MISWQVLLETISKPDFIEQAINNYRLKGYRVRSRKRPMTIKLKGGSHGSDQNRLYVATLI